MSKAHHPSCKPNDRSLVWHCSQCGLNEDAEAELSGLRAKLAKAIEDAANYKMDNHKTKAKLAAVEKQLSDADNFLMRRGIYREEVQVLQDRLDKWDEGALKAKEAMRHARAVLWGSIGGPGAKKDAADLLTQALAHIDYADEEKA